MKKFQTVGTISDGSDVDHYRLRRYEEAVKSFREAAGTPRFHVVTNLIAQLLVVFAAFYLVGPLGILGAGLAGLIAPIFLYFSTMIFLRRTYGLRLPTYLFARSIWLLLGLVATGLMGAHSQTLSVQTLLFKLGLYILMVGGLALLLTGQERQRIREIFDGWRAKWM